MLAELCELGNSTLNVKLGFSKFSYPVSLVNFSVLFTGRVRRTEV